MAHIIFTETENGLFHIQTLDHSHKGIFFINKLSIDVWFVRIVQYFVEIQLFENLEFGCK